MSPTLKRIAMWSGPRNVSTALMRAWENRDDCQVWDEPFYAYYLQSTKLDHPGAAEVIATHEPDPIEVIRRLRAPLASDLKVHYQKHMAHHLLAGLDRDWFSDLEHGFLIRNPREMLVSLDAKLPAPRLEDTGFPQLVEIFDTVRRQRGTVPPVVDSRDILQRPASVLRALCQSFGVEFSEQMLAWPAGPRESDGVWAKHWYANVEKSTGFQPYQPKEGDLAPHLRGLHEECRPYYEHLYPFRLSADE